MSTATEAPGELPEVLVQRLESLAAKNGGHVLLHGRLFRQWMHHVFPAECSFPALPGQNRPRSPDQFMEETGLEAFISDDQLRVYKEANRPAALGHTTVPPVLNE